VILFSRSPRPSFDEIYTAGLCCDQGYFLEFEVGVKWQMFGGGGVNMREAQIYIKKLKRRKYHM